MRENITFICKEIKNKIVIIKKSLFIFFSHSYQQRYEIKLITVVEWCSLPFFILLMILDTTFDIFDIRNLISITLSILLFIRARNIPPRYVYRFQLLGRKQYEHMKYTFLDRKIDIVYDYDIEHAAIREYFFPCLGTIYFNSQFGETTIYITTNIKLEGEDFYFVIGQLSKRITLKKMTKRKKKFLKNHPFLDENQFDINLFLKLGQKIDIKFREEHKKKL